MHEIIHGRLCVKLGNRYFAVSRDIDKASRVHAQTQLSSTWDRQMTKPKARCIRTRSIRNARA